MYCMYVQEVMISLNVPLQSEPFFFLFLQFKHHCVEWCMCRVEHYEVVFMNFLRGGPMNIIGDITNSLEANGPIFRIHYLLSLYFIHCFITFSFIFFYYNIAFITHSVSLLSFTALSFIIGCTPFIAGINTLCLAF